MRIIEDSCSTEFSIDLFDQKFKLLSKDWARVFEIDCEETNNRLKIESEVFNSILNLKTRIRKASALEKVDILLWFCERVSHLEI